MKLYPMPGDIVEDSIVFFRSGKRRKDLVAWSALDVFLDRIERGEIGHEKARALLADPRKEKLIGFIEKYRQKSLADQRKLDELAERKKHRLLQEMARDVKNVKGYTDPKTTGKAGFWTNIKAGVVLSIAAFVTGPLPNIFFKQQLKALDKWFNPEDYVAVETIKKPENTTVKNGSPKKSSSEALSGDEIVNLNDGAFGPHNSNTAESFVDLLRAGKTVLMPIGDGNAKLWVDDANLCARPNPPIVCKPQEYRPR